jgi:hypothetical protein
MSVITSLLGLVIVSHLSLKGSGRFNNPRVAGIGDDYEVPLFEMDNAVQPL